MTAFEAWWPYLFIIIAGWLIYAAVYIGFAFAGSAWQIWTLFIVYGMFFGLTEGVEKALVADLVPDEKRGTAYGFYNLAFGITVFPASLLFGLVWTQFGSSKAFVISAAISVAAAILLTFGVHSGNPAHEPEIAS